MNTEDEISVNKQLKDSLFKHLFRDIKCLKKLYSALYDDVDNYKDEDFQLITLENTLVYDVKHMILLKEFPETSVNLILL